MSDADRVLDDLQTIALGNTWLRMGNYRDRETEMHPNIDRNAADVPV